jgi:uncharacterized protein YecE (DUF72 family)
MRLFVGQSAAGSDLRRYASRFNLLEVRAGPGMPKPATLKRWVTEVPSGFAFSLVLPESVCSLEQSSIDAAALSQALEAADALAAAWLVVRTPPSARPSSRTRRRLEELVAQLPRNGRRIAWEPRGLWEDDDAEQLAESLDVHLVRDVSRSEAPPSDVVYARLRALGGGGRVSSGAIDSAIDELVDKREVFIVIEGASAVRAAKMLREALALTGDAGGEPEGGEEDDFDDEDDEDEDEFDEEADDEDEDD